MTQHQSVRGSRAGGLLAFLLIAVLGLAACTDGGTGGTNGASGQGDTQDAVPPAKVSVLPGAGAKDIAPREDVRVSVDSGTIQSVALTNPQGEKVKGTLAPDKRSWTVAEPLGYSKTYTWSGKALGQDGKQVPIEGSFGTVSPAATIGASSNVGDGDTYGIAMPVAITFDAPVTNKAAVERALTVETTPKQEGSWAWLEGDTSAHWRPKGYWQPGTKVTVKADVYGVDFGDGVYGANDLAAHFTIGRSQVVKADTQSHRMVVYRDGKQIADYPASFGLDSDPGRVTHSGTHVVMSKHSTYFMNNPGYGYEDFEVNWAVRISNNGEFTHSAPWSVSSQGNTNTSHGCINLAPDAAKAYYDTVLTGDPVEITGSTQQLDAADGDYHDWTYSWPQWNEMSALSR